MKQLYKIPILILASVGLMITTARKADAQGPIEAYRLGAKGLHGTARAQGLGGAVGALGADPTAVYVNPAGLGLYSRATLTISADPGSGKSIINWSNPTLPANNATTTTTKYDASGFQHVSYMLPMIESFDSGYKFSMGIAYNKDYNYERQYGMSTGVLGAGLADLLILIGMDEGIAFDKYIDRNGYDPFKQMVHPLVSMGANADLIRPFDGNQKLFAHKFLDTFNGSALEQLSPDKTNLFVNEKGDRNSVDITMSMTFGDILHVGGSLRLGSINHVRASEYREDFRFVHRTTSETKDSHMILANGITTTGTSASFNIGALLLLGDHIRLGVSYATPEAFRLEEAYYSRMTTHDAFEPLQTRELTFKTQTYSNQYTLKTPSQFTASAMGLFGRYGFISYDFQYRDLGTAKLYRDGAENPLNEYIREDYAKEITHKVGIEVRPTTQLSLRGGVSYTGNPMKQGTGFDAEPQDGLTRDALAVGTVPDFALPRTYETLSLGVGYRFTKKIALDLTYAHTTRTEQVYPFTGYLNKEKHLGLPDLKIKGGTMSDIRQNLVATLTFAF